MEVTLHDPVPFHERVSRHQNRAAWPWFAAGVVLDALFVIALLVSRFHA
jgi:hypothetical protein